MGRLRGFGRTDKQGRADQPPLREALDIALANGQAGRHDRAVGLYRQILQRWPDSAEAHHNLGLLLVSQGHHGDALACQERAAALKPADARIHFARGCALETLERLEEAVEAYQRATSLAPDFAEAHYNLGNALRVLGHWEKAAAAYRRAIALMPDALAFNNLGHVLDGQGKLLEAEACYRQALALDPYLFRVHTNLGTALEEQGRTAEALACFEHALALEPGCAPALWHSKLCLPVLYSTPEEIDPWHRRFEHNLGDLIALTPLDTPEACARALEGASTQVNFYLQYQGLDDTALQGCYGTFVHRVMAANYPEWAAPPTAAPLAPGEKIRIGYVSSYILSHSGTRWVLGWMAHLDRSKFEIHCYHTGQEVDGSTTRFSDLSDRFHHVPESFEAACRKIRADRLHVLIYPDIGMEPKTTQMAALRLAPVQCGAWGHPATTGLPTVDYFFSGAAMEPEDPQRYYTEQLVLLPKIGVCYARPPVPAPTHVRSDFGLAAADFVYLSCQSLFKYLPQHDWVYAAIAGRVPEARFVFVAHPSPHVTELFCKRLERAFAERGIESNHFCRVLPRQSYSGYLDLLRVSDVFLDTFEFSGGNTSLEAIAFGLPVVTCPKSLMRGRLAHGMLKVMGIDETVARDEAAYVEIAVRLALDLAWREQLVQRMAQGQAGLFEDTACVAALAGFLERVVVDRQSLEPRGGGALVLT